MINDIMELFQSCSNFNAYNFVLKSTFQRDLKKYLENSTDILVFRTHQMKFFIRCNTLPLIDILCFHGQWLWCR